MQNRISEMEDEQVDYLRFDRIKIQRKRMEHILQVIKDLSFKNKQLFKENAALKQERIHESHYQKLYHQLTTERTILIEKNLQTNSQLEKYRQTVLHQEILINSLKQQLYGENISIYRSNHYDLRQDELQSPGKQQLIIQQYRILQAQYKDLKKEYSKIYKIISSNEFSNQKVNLNKHFQKVVNGKQNELYTQCKHLQHSHSHSRSIACQKLICHNQQDNLILLKMKEKYDKCKRSKKELSNELKILRESINSYELRQKRHVELIEILKQKRTKICLCHVNKLKKKMSQTMFQNADTSFQPTLHN